MTTVTPPSQPGDDWDIERQDWLESIDYIHQHYGEGGVKEILRTLQNHILTQDISLNEATLNTPYRNSISPAEEPLYPGNIGLEENIEKLIRWNAAAMVVRATDQGAGVGGHIATYTSAATMMEVGFHHYFRNRSATYGGDLVITQPHAAPGLYARAFLEGRLSRQQLDNFRRQLAPEGGLSSYPHPRQMPNFWQVPSGSMGLSTPTAIYQARFVKYLENRGLKPRNGGKVWCFIGDGESDEPEVLGTINIAAREELDNLILVVNCNLQRLDGPVRGNGKIIQELERTFRGADWNVIKVIWGSGWDSLLARDHRGVLQKRMEEAVDGDYQYLSVSPGDVQRELWVENNPELKALMNTLTDEEVRLIKRGGQDHKKINAAYQKALEAKGRPTVILIKSVKGYGLVKGQGRNTAHQKKQLSGEERLELAHACNIPLETHAIEAADFYRPSDDSPEMQYLKAKREKLGGYLPTRTVHCHVLSPPPLSTFAEFFNGSERPVSTTMAMVRMLAVLMKDASIGRYIVPIVPDEARTFGLDGLFRQAGIYSPEGQHYTPVDGGSLLPYREAEDGQILQEGICETGAMASFLAAGTAYAMHGVPTIPFYMFYSIFGFQRVGDMIWACGDMMCRGFLLGGTAGRTTLNGEGLQHQDGHSHVVANTVPSLKSYDPAFAYELAIIVREGIRRMYQEQESIFYYLTIYNENYSMPEIEAPEAVEAGVLSGLYCYRRSELEVPEAKVHVLGSGSVLQQALEAQACLAEHHIAADVWSATSYNELYRDAMACERWNRLHPMAEPRVPYIQQCLLGEEGVFVAVSDYMKALPSLITPWVPGRYVVLGTDGYGMSEARPELRAYFEIDSAHITAAAMYALAQEGQIKFEQVEEAIVQLGIDANKVDPAVQ